MTRILHLERKDFLENYWPGLYAPGEDVAFFEPKGQGKTQIAWQMLKVTLRENPELRFASLMPKPRDPPTRLWAEQLGLRITPTWPPPPPVPFLQRRPRGHVLWPIHYRNLPIEQRRARIAAELRKCLNGDLFWRGNSIVLADDVYVLVALYGLNPDLEEWWTTGQAMQAGLWSPNQKPSGTISGGAVSSFAYNAPAHILLGKDPDVRNQRRFGEIGGFDPALISQIVANLRIYPIHTPQGIKNISDKLYLCKRGYMCTIGI